MAEASIPDVGISRPRCALSAWSFEARGLAPRKSRLCWNTRRRTLEVSGIACLPAYVLAPRVAWLRGLKVAEETILLRQTTMAPSGSSRRHQSSPPLEGCSSLRVRGLEQEFDSSRRAPRRHTILQLPAQRAAGLTSDTPGARPVGGHLSVFGLCHHKPGLILLSLGSGWMKCQRLTQSLLTIWTPPLTGLQRNRLIRPYFRPRGP